MVVSWIRQISKQIHTLNKRLNIAVLCFLLDRTPKVQVRLLIKHKIFFITDTLISKNFAKMQEEVLFDKLANSNSSFLLKRK